jgi:hypothetical protein
MIKAKGIQRIGKTTWLDLEVPGAETPTKLGLYDGVIESYQGSLRLPDPADVVVLLIIDALVEDIDSQIPAMDDPQASEKVQEMLSRYSQQFEWNGLRDELVSEAAITDEETAAQVRGLWAKQRDYFIENPEQDMGPVDVAFQIQEKLAEAHRQTMEERLADEMVGALPEPVRNQPRIAEQEGARIGLKFTFTE